MRRGIQMLVRGLVLAIAGAILFAGSAAVAQDRIKVGVFTVSSSFPYYLSLDRVSIK
jgi:hypothetical protein